MSRGNLVLLEDDLLLASALQQALQQEPRLTLAGAFDDVDDLLSAVKLSDIDLLLVSSRFLRDTTLRSAIVDVSTLVLLKDDVEAALTDAMEAGATGGVPWTVPYPALLANVDAALRGEVCVPRELLGGLLGHLIERNRRQQVVDERLAALSPRERETLSLLVTGLEISEIADQLFVSRQTVRSHVRAIMTKLDVSSRLEAIQLARSIDTTHQLGADHAR